MWCTLSSGCGSDRLRQWESIITLIVAIAFWALDALIVILGFILHRGQGEQSYMAPAPVSTVCCITQLTHMANLSVSTGVRQSGNICSGRRLGNIFALFASILLYIPLGLWARGNIQLDEDVWWDFHFQQATNLDPNVRTFRGKTLIMLSCPPSCVPSHITTLMQYLDTQRCTACSLPMSVVRWLTIESLEPQRIDGDGQIIEQVERGVWQPQMSFKQWHGYCRITSIDQRNLITVLLIKL